MFCEGFEVWTCINSEKRKQKEKRVRYIKSVVLVYELKTLFHYTRKGRDQRKVITLKVFKFFSTTGKSEVPMNRSPSRSVLDLKGSSREL